MKFTDYVVIGLLIVMTLPAMGASSYLGGFSGIIMTPDDTVLPTRTWEASFHDTFKLFGGRDSDLQTYGLTYGLVPNLEVGASYIKAGSNDVALNGKYRLLSESASTPGITVGVFDAAGSVDSINGDASFYLMLSKNITSFASNVSGQPSKPLRMGLGFGSGFYDGVMVNLDWTLQPQLSLLAEYQGGNGGNSRLHNRPSVGLRWAATDAIRLDAASVGFRDIGVGISYRTTLK